jgi:hypothetical protein
MREMRKKVRVAGVGLPNDYLSGLIPLLINAIGYSIEWTGKSNCDLLIVGPFLTSENRRHRWLPRPLRPAFRRLAEYLDARRSRPVTLFHTAENRRYDDIPADFAITFDLGVDSKKHLRFPYWMEFLDWAHEGVTGNTNPRFGELLSIPQLMGPLGTGFLGKPRIAALFASHLREPRRLL